MTTPQGYWVGPYGMLVPNDVQIIRHIDGCNYLCKNGSRTGIIRRIDGRNYLLKDGSKTGMVATQQQQHSISMEEYLSTYADKHVDGFYYFRAKMGLSE